MGIVMQKCFFILLLFTFIFSVPSWAKLKTYKLSSGTFQIDVPDDWQAAPDLYGVPIIFLGPQVGERRPTIAIVPTPIEGATFDPQGMAKDQENYKQGREKWLKSHNGKAVEYFPYKFSQWAKAAEVHTVGYKYLLGTLQFIEHSHYVVCEKKLFIIKTLILDKYTNIYTSTIDNILRSFTCGK